MEKRNRIAEINTDADNTRKQLADDANLVAHLAEMEAGRFAELNKFAGARGDTFSKGCDSFF